MNGSISCARSDWPPSRSSPRRCLATWRASPIVARPQVRFGVVEAIEGNIKAVIRRGRGYKDLRYLLLKVQRMAATKTEFIAVQKAA